MKTTSLRTVFAVIALLACCRAAQAQGLQGDGIWIRNAYYGEAQTFDKCLGHQPGNGQYHHHAHPVSAKHGLAWYEFDWTWVSLNILKAVGLVWDLKVAKIKPSLEEAAA